MGTETKVRMCDTTGCKNPATTMLRTSDGEVFMQYCAGCAAHVGRQIRQSDHRGRPTLSMMEELKLLRMKTKNETLIKLNILRNSELYGKNQHY